MSPPEQGEITNLLTNLTTFGPKTMKNEGFTPQNMGYNP